MKLCLIAITEGGRKLAAELAQPLSASILSPEEGIKKTFAKNWNSFDGFICIMAAGIVVRGIAPLLASKKTDPAVVVLDEKGQHVISLLSGHLGGANDLARDIAVLTNGTPVITTASDTLQLPALDLWARSQNLVTNDADLLTRASARLVNNKELLIYTEVPVSTLPAAFTPVDSPDKADIIVSIKTYKETEKLVLHPKNIVVGIGCKRGTTMEELDRALTELCAELDISSKSICRLCSIDKKSDEPGLLELSRSKKLPINFFSSEQINKITELQVSEAAMKAVGAIGVAEPCALLGAGTVSVKNLICKKRKWKNLTIAMAQESFTLSQQAQEP